MINVELLSFTPEPARLIAKAAKLCYSNSNISDITKNMSDEEVSKYINKLIGMNHLSPFEHASFTFGIEGISRACSHQLVRHRIASYSQQSQRYVENDLSYYEPEVFKNNKKLHDMYNLVTLLHSEAYEQVSSSLYIELMKEEYGEKVCKELEKYSCPINEVDVVGVKNELKEKFPKESKKIEKKVLENARYVLPNASKTKIIVTMNVRSLMNFFSLRCCSRAQEEIREVANIMLEKCKEVSPEIFKTAGPECLRSKCSEGVMTCGNPWKK